MNKELSFEFRAFMDSVEITEKPLGYYISVQTDAKTQKITDTSLRKTSERGATLMNLLEAEGKNGQEIAQFLVDKVYMLEIPVYKTDEAVI